VPKRNDLKFQFRPAPKPARKQRTERGDERKHAGDDTVADYKTIGLLMISIFSVATRRADFHQGPERTMKLLKQAEYMAATGFTLHQAIAFRSGLGPYKGQDRAGRGQSLCW